MSYPDAPVRQRASTLDIVALVLAVLLAPVGLIVAVVAGIRPRPQNVKASTVGVVATVTAAILTPLQVGAVALLAVLGSGLISGANDERYCDAVRANQDILVAIGQADPTRMQGSLSADEVEEIYTLLTQVHEFAEALEGLPSDAEAAHRIGGLASSAEGSANDVKINAGWVYDLPGSQTASEGHLERVQELASAVLADPEGLCR